MEVDRDGDTEDCAGGGRDAKYAATAAKHSKTLRGKNITPHTLRHTYATGLLVRRVASDATAGGIRRIA